MSLVLIKLSSCVYMFEKSVKFICSYLFYVQKRVLKFIGIECVCICCCISQLPDSVYSSYSF